MHKNETIFLKWIQIELVEVKKHGLLPKHCLLADCHQEENLLNHQKDLKARIAWGNWVL